MADDEAGDLDTAFVDGTAEADAEPAEEEEGDAGTAFIEETVDTDPESVDALADDTDDTGTEFIEGAEDDTGTEFVDDTGDTGTEFVGEPEDAPLEDDDLLAAAAIEGDELEEGLEPDEEQEAKRGRLRRPDGIYTLMLVVANILVATALTLATLELYEFYWPKKGTSQPGMKRREAPPKASPKPAASGSKAPKAKSPPKAKAKG